MRGDTGHVVFGDPDMRMETPLQHLTKLNTGIDIQLTERQRVPRTFWEAAHACRKLRGVARKGRTWGLRQRNMQKSCRASRPLGVPGPRHLWVTQPLRSHPKGHKHTCSSHTRQCPLPPVLAPGPHSLHSWWPLMSWCCRLVLALCTLDVIAGTVPQPGTCMTSLPTATVIAVTLLGANTTPGLNISQWVHRHAQAVCHMKALCLCFTYGASK